VDVEDLCVFFCVFFPVVFPVFGVCSLAAASASESAWRPRPLSPLRGDGVPVSFGLGCRLRRRLRRALEAREAPPRPGRSLEAQRALAASAASTASGPHAVAATLSTRVCSRGAVLASDATPPRRHRRVSKYQTGRRPVPAHPHNSAGPSSTSRRCTTKKRPSPSLFCGAASGT
jgi:hypothetical protein